MRMTAHHLSCLSLPGLTRQSIRRFRDRLCKTNARVNPGHFFYCFVFVALVAVCFASTTVFKAEAGADRSAAILGADVAKYANYLYLSELFGAPTAIPLYNRFCGDTLDNTQIRSLDQNDLDNIVRDKFWKFKCTPVVSNV